MKEFRKGFMNVFFLGGLMVVLMCTLVLTEEAGRMRLKRNELQSMLAFDYRVEAYYLLLESGAIHADKESAYGSLMEYKLVDHSEGENDILIERIGETIHITGYFQGRQRGLYEISK